MRSSSLRLLVLPALVWASAALAQPPSDAGPLQTAPQDAAPVAPPPALLAPSPQEEAKTAASEQDVATMKALQAMHACLDSQVKAADDHVSPPDEIAQKIKDACRTEQDRFIAAYKIFAADHPRMEPPPDQISEADRLAAARAAVVEARREQR